MSLPNAGSPLSIEEFGALFSSFERSAFRLETLPEYAVDQEIDVFNRWLAGEPNLPKDWLPEWFQQIADSTNAGREWTQIHAFAGGLNPYLKYEIEWAYVMSDEAGMKVAILDDPRPQHHFGALPYEDFWLFDDSVVVAMDYDAEGHFTGARKITDPATVSRYRQARDVALRHATPLAEYRRTHREALSRRGTAEPAAPSAAKPSGAARGDLSL